MLTLQRASAGSGKTYSLTRTYLKLLLGRRQDNGSYRLRQPAETRDAHNALLAITFTNKATAEMRRRFIDELAAMADPATYFQAGYMDYFVKTFNAPAEMIQRIAAQSLRVILNHYSDFQVSTIDSFFQQILHSFTYEAELPDNYVVELDTKNIIGTALEALFHKAAGQPGSDERYWLDCYMNYLQHRGHKWNLSAQGSRSPYATLIKYLQMIDKEEFKQERDRLEQFFAAIPDMRAFYEKVRQAGKSYVRHKFDEAIEVAATLKRRIEESGVEPDMSQHLRNRLMKLENSDSPFDNIFGKPLSSLKNIIKKSGQKRLSDSDMAELTCLEQEMVKSTNRWMAVCGYVDEVEKAIALLALVRYLLVYIEKYRVDNNIVQLSDTNTILHAITEGSEVSFIYEKIGNKIDSYLIDEFQDTSTMQWNNMHPLVLNSMADGHDNLIIGDAKQSIYRFRNANSSLITRELPALFQRHPIEVLGATPEENANWRSSGHVVRFNNTLFTLLSGDISAAMPGMVNKDILDTYSGVLQKPMKDAMPGYVRISSSEKDREMAYLGPAIASMISRGYRQKDIAVLVRTNEEGKQAVKAIADFNTLHRDTPGFVPVEVISDEALLISRAVSVGIIEAMMHSVKLAFSGGLQEKGSEGYSKAIEDFRIDMNRLRMEHPDEDVEALLDLYFAGGELTDHASLLLSDRQSTSLVALVENIVTTFVPASLRVSEAQYISAFQDAIADFSETHTPDVASFLHWWSEKKLTLCVTSPEDADAVDILTVHKSKGLEWRCVIVAESSFSLSVSGSEKAWLPPAEPFDDIITPLLPIDISSRLEDTPYEKYYNVIHLQTQLDALNLAYVAFTRAVDELHVFLKDDRNSISELIRNRLKKEALTLSADGMSADCFMDADAIHIHDGESEMEGEQDAGVLMTYGMPLSPAYIKERYDAMDSARQNEVGICTLSSYEVNNESNIPACVPDKALRITDSEGTATQRRLGSVKHAVLENIDCKGPRSELQHELMQQTERLLLRYQVRGLITEAEVERAFGEFEAAFSDPAVREWFSPENKRYAERSVFDGERGETVRPDRIVADREGNATVIDYKFGKPYGKYIRTMRYYVALLRKTNLFASVKGVIWYITSGKLEFVE